MEEASSCTSKESLASISKGETPLISSFSFTPSSPARMEYSSVLKEGVNTRKGAEEDDIWLPLVVSSLADDIEDEEKMRNTRKRRTLQ